MIRSHSRHAVASLKRAFGPWIYPIDEVLRSLADHHFESVLDVGAGTGFFLETLERNFGVKKLMGTEINPVYFRNPDHNITITEAHNIEGRFDLLIFNDVLHHVTDKQTFLLDHIERFLNPGGLVLIKEMRPQNFVHRSFNRLHDLIFSGQFITEIAEAEVERILESKFIALSRQRKVVFLYDHYFILFRQITETSLPPTSKTISASGINEYK